MCRGALGLEEVCSMMTRLPPAALVCPNLSPWAETARITRRNTRAVDEEVEVRADALHLRDEALGLVDVCLETLDELRDVRDGVHLALGGERGPLHGEVRLLEVPGPSHAGQIVRVGLFRLDKHLDLGVEPLHELVEDILACGEVLVRHLRRHTV